ncbi:MAG TPA: SRPBCC family protein [Vicinamibacterales bacterium]|nr:SRPBCC family protein [Vicinamibacterales bacterium]
MKDYSVSVQIEAPPDRVWSVMSDIERWHEWTPTITRVQRTNAGPFRIGARARVHQPRLPAADWMVTAIQEGRSFTWESRAPGLRVTARHQVEAVGTGSRVTLSIQYSGVVGNLLGRLIAGINRRYIALEADGLKRRAESEAAHA